MTQPDISTLPELCPDCGFNFKRSNKGIYARLAPASRFIKVAGYWLGWLWLLAVIGIVVWWSIEKKKPYHWGFYTFAGIIGLLPLLVMKLIKTVEPRVVDIVCPSCGYTEQHRIRM